MNFSGAEEWHNNWVEITNVWNLFFHCLINKKNCLMKSLEHWTIGRLWTLDKCTHSFHLLFFIYYGLMEKNQAVNFFPRWFYLKIGTQSLGDGLASNATLISDIVPILRENGPHLKYSNDYISIHTQAKKKMLCKCQSVHHRYVHTRSLAQARARARTLSAVWLNRLPFNK